MTLSISSLSVNYISFLKNVFLLQVSTPYFASFFLPSLKPCLISSILCTGVLFSAGIELLFSLVAGMLFYFGFRMRTMVIAHRCSNVFVVAKLCLHRAKDFSTSPAVPPARRLGVHKDLGGDTTRTVDPNGPKGCPTPCGLMRKK